LTGHNTTGSGLTGQGSHLDHSHNDPTGPHSSHLANSADPRVDSDRLGNAGNTGAYGSNTGGIGSGGIGSHGDNFNTTGHGAHGTHGTTHGSSDVHGKPSMMDKLNPKKDADHDGKTGIMD
jgi:hypothetical protein